MIPILLANHSNSIVCYQKEMLTLCGYTVVGRANTPEETIELFKELNPGFVALDFHPEKFDTIKAIEGIQSINSEVPIIVTSAWGFGWPFVEAFRLGIKDWSINTFPTQSLRFMIAVDLLIGDETRIKVMESILKEDMKYCFAFLRRQNIYGL